VTVNLKKEKNLINNQPFLANFLNAHQNESNFGPTCQAVIDGEEYKDSALFQ